MLTSVEICNIALSHLGIGKTISALDNTTALGAACNAFFTLAQREVLRDFPWPFAQRIVTLTDTEDDATTDWIYTYEFPANCVKLHRLLNPAVGRKETSTSKIPYTIARDATDVKRIYTDLADAEAQYTHFISDTTEYDPDLVSALSYRVAAYIAPRVTNGDKFRLGQRAMENYAWRLGMAARNAAHEVSPDIQERSELHQARD